MKKAFVFLVSISYGMQLPFSQKKMIYALPMEYHFPVSVFSVFETKKSGLLYAVWFLKYASKQLSLELPFEIIDKILDDYFPLFFL